MRARILNNYLPAAAWIGYHAAVPVWSWNFLKLLMLVRAGIVLVCFLIRDEPLRRAPPIQIAIAWISTFLPVLMVCDPIGGLSTMVGELVAVAGIALFSFACLELGRSFGVSPAVRSPITSGVYRALGHPMYVAHVIVEIGILIASPTPFNFVIAAAAWALYLVRARWEAELVGRFLERPLEGLHGSQAGTVF